VFWGVVEDDLVGRIGEECGAGLAIVEDTTFAFYTEIHHQLGFIGNPSDQRL